MSCPDCTRCKRTSNNCSKTYDNTPCSRHRQSPQKSYRNKLFRDTRPSYKVSAWQDKIFRPAPRAPLMCSPRNRVYLWSSVCTHWIVLDKALARDLLYAIGEPAHRAPLDGYPRGVGYLNQGKEAALRKPLPGLYPWHAINLSILTIQHPRRSPRHRTVP